MLNDPLSVTYDSVAKSLPRSARVRSGLRKVLATSAYGTPDGEFAVFVTRSQLGDGMERTEILLERIQMDADGPFVGNWYPAPNRVGLILEANSLRINTETDIPKLRTALLALVDSVLQDRLIGGEV
jgi:hypothetical protein